MTQTVKIELTVQEANLVLNALGQMPYIQVAEFIGKFKTQADSQLQSALQQSGPAPT